MALFARESSIVYGPVTIGGSSSVYHLDGFSRHTVADGPSSVEFDTVVVVASAESLAMHCRSLERTFRTPRLDLAIVQKGNLVLAAGHTDVADGFNTDPEIVKIGQVGDSGRSRRYTLRVRYETPADTVSTPGLRESTVSVAYDAARLRTITISGVFTAVSGTTSARARYAAAIAAHVTAVLSALSVTYSDLVGEPVTEQDYDDKTVRFEREYREYVIGKGQDDPNTDTSILDQRLVIARREFAEERSPSAPVQESEDPGVAGGSEDAGSVGTVQALAIYDLRYECSIDKTQSTDLASKYASIRSWLVEQVATFFAQGSFALTVERPEYDRTGNRITVAMTAEGAVRATDWVRRTVTTERRITAPEVFRGVWDGDPLSYYTYQGHTIDLRVVTTSGRRLSSGAARGGGGGGGGGSGEGWVVVESSSSSTPVRIGIEGSGRTLDMVDVTSSVTYRRVHASGGGGSGGFSDPGPGTEVRRRDAGGILGGTAPAGGG